MNLTLAMLLAPVLGAVLAFAAMFGLVVSQTSAPSKNPANQSVIVYGQ